MKTNRTMLVVAALWLTTAVTVFAASAHIGTWKLDEAKSKLSPGATKNQIVTYTEAKGEMIKLTVEGVDRDGKAVEWTWTGKFDGQPHKVKGADNADQIAYTMKDDHTNEMTVMKGGKTVITGTITVAKDGKSRVVKTTMTDADGKKQTEKAYYNKE
ncbi:MAG: hypothetical protein ABIU29_03460 [Chthoniobacterales bacterium]